MSERAGCGGCAAAAYVVALVLAACALGGALLYASMQVDARGATSPAQVLAKRETLRVQYDAWSPERELTVRYTPPGTARTWPRVTRIDVPDEATFDATRVGARVLVRSVPRSELATMLGLPAVRLATRSTIADLRLTLLPTASALLRFALAVLVVLVLLWLWLRTRSRLAAIGAVAAALLALGWSSVPDLPEAPAPPLGRATAVVRDVHRIARAGEGDESSGIELLAPYQLVALAFVPGAAGDTVLAVDAVDDGGVAGLAPGARVPVSYSLARPRLARIEGAPRRFARTNLVGLWVAWPLTLVAVIAVVVLGVMLLRRVRGAATGRQHPRPS